MGLVGTQGIQVNEYVLKILQIYSSGFGRYSSVLPEEYRFVAHFIDEESTHPKYMYDVRTSERQIVSFSDTLFIEAWVLLIHYLFVCNFHLFKQLRAQEKVATLLKPF